ncbi:GlsB/YeaQ/YmgE family stress response membrane protein [Segnochrobactrum spirostomi]|uniref:GlsB/YeaQ/YmgE family stress response membrane protein n=1 Tax=Segnochrobactrum spirostomi TaxID=2608987 RepID=A0A6A7XZ93_9HYPH|nr:GlsB/YeaQ/YmgE family stress response membrane protein [Segnochrobactrum spirostomi]MQT11437.1 GlsB/YeaQ/YmgE family stress response membrane protein [Segnochrobactrum spirostomi]
MNGVGFFSAIIIGIFAGWVAERAFNRRHGLLKNLVVGLIGSFLGGFLARTLNIQVMPGFGGSLVVSIVGALVLLFLLGLFSRRD